EVVRATQPMAVALGVEHLDLAGLQVDPLDAAAAVVLRLVAGNQQTVDLVPLETAIVTDVDLSVRPDRRAVWTAAGLGDHLDLAVRRHARQRAAFDLDQDHAAVR